MNRRALLRYLSLALTPALVGSAPLGCGDDGEPGETESGTGAETESESETEGESETSDATSETETEGTTGEPVCDPTAPDVEGPFYSEGAPEVSAIADEGEPGDRIVITGTLFDLSDCTTPLADHILDLWHTDADGVYDNEGFHLRGKVRTDANGAFRVETIMPGMYPDRPVRHIHFKIRDPDGEELLTTQFYFEGDPELTPNHTGPRVALSEGAGSVDLFV